MANTSETNQSGSTEQEERKVVAATPVEAEATQGKKSFDVDLIKKYPKANRKLSLFVESFGLKAPDRDDDAAGNSQSIHISPHGVEFRSTNAYPEGTL